MTWLGVLAMSLPRRWAIIGCIVAAKTEASDEVLEFNCGAIWELLMPLTLFGRISLASLVFASVIIQGQPNDKKITDDPNSVPARAKVTFVQFVGINDGHPPPELADVAAEYEGKTFPDAAWAPGFGERVRDIFQKHGFFKAEVRVRFDVSEPGTEVSPIVTIDKGIQYRLKKIEISGVKVFPATQLCPLFLLNQGEFSDVAHIRFGV